MFSTSVGRVWFSPDKTKAVLEIWSSELYVAVKNINKDKNDYMVCDYVDHYINISFRYDFRHFCGVDWNFIDKGFCKLMSFSIDTGEEFVKRLYYERE